MNLGQFKKEYDGFGSTCSLWGQDNIEFGVSFEERDAPIEKLADYLPAVEGRMEYLQNNKALVEEVILAAGMLALAEDWAAEAFEVEDEGDNCFSMEDGNKVFLPIAQQDFLNSLRVDSFGFNCTPGKENIGIDLYLRCTPDYFAGHSINVLLRPNREPRCSLCG